MEQKLKECPFCGGEAQELTGRTDTGIRQFPTTCIKCIRCGANTGYKECTIKTKNQAEKLWNTRTKQLTK